MSSKPAFQLYKISSDQTASLIVDNMQKATSFFERGKGLLGRKSFLSNEALWINPCNNIHTFFMNFSIDCVFVDEKLKVKYLKSEIKPFRVAGPFWRARSVFELPSGTIKKMNLNVGDQLYVVG